jgi:hypothetical protein
MSGDDNRGSTVLDGQLGNLGVLGDLLAQVGSGSGEMTWTGVFGFGAAGTVTLSIRDVAVDGMPVPARDLLLTSAARLATLGMSQTGLWPADSLSPTAGGRGL